MPTINSKLVPNCHCGKCSYQPDHCHFSVIGLGSTRSVPTLRSMSLPRNSAVPALADLAHFWQHFGTDVHVAAVWGFASASTGRLGTLLAAIWHWCLHSVSEAVEAANSYSVMLGIRGVGFTKGGQNWPQICSRSLRFQDRGLWSHFGNFAIF